jgi:hypothetical protein
VRSAPVESDSIANLSPVIDQFVDKRAQLKTDELHAYKLIGKKYASHQWVNHQSKEYSRGEFSMCCPCTMKFHRGSGKHFGLVNYYSLLLVRIIEGQHTYD